MCLALLSWGKWGGGSVLKPLSYDYSEILQFDDQQNRAKDKRARPLTRVVTPCWLSPNQFPTAIV